MQNVLFGRRKSAQGHAFLALPRGCTDQSYGFFESKPPAVKYQAQSLKAGKSAQLRPQIPQCFGGCKEHLDFESFGQSNSRVAGAEGTIGGHGHKTSLITAVTNSKEEFSPGFC